MTTHLHIDFETRSTVDLKKAGLDVYAKSPTTEVLCMAWSIGEGPVKIWTPEKDGGIGIEDVREFNTFLGEVVHGEGQWKGGLVFGHNVSFEIAIWNEIMVPRFGWPRLKPEQCRCTMAMAYAMSLPGSLDNAAAALGVDYRKDQVGYRLMLAMCKPKADGTYREDPESLARLYEYCKQDVEVEREIARRMMALSPAEQDIWTLDYKINNRGIAIDVPAIKAAMAVVNAEKERLDAEIKKATGGAISTCNQAGAIVDWIVDQGVGIPSVAKADVLDALSVDGLPANVRRVLLLRQEAAKSSNAKLKTMLECVSSDGRVRNTLQYHGAGTGRWAGRKIQVQNFPRPKLKQKAIEEVISLLGKPNARDSIDLFYGSPMTVISDCLRGFMIAPPGRKLIAADFANIEGRVLAWLAGEEWKLQAFRDFDAGMGTDIYILTYVKSFHLDPSTIDEDDPRRQVGKVEELAFGFGGGVGAWRTMEKAYRPPPMTDDQINDIKDRWRAAHPKIKAYWRALEDAAVAAVLKPGAQCSAGPANRQVQFRASGSFLWCLLPSGRVLCYPYPKIVAGKFGGDALSYMTVDSITKKWERTDTYGGKLAENVTQAIARDVMANGLVKADDAGFETVFSVHDEGVLEVDDEDATPETLNKVSRLLCSTPQWAANLPVVAKGWIGQRYRK